MDRGLTHIRALLQTGDHDEVVSSAGSASEPGAPGSGTSRRSTTC